MLRERSRTANRKLIDLAAAVVEATVSSRAPACLVSGLMPAAVVVLTLGASCCNFRFRVPAEAEEPFGGKSARALPMLVE